LKEDRAGPDSSGNTALAETESGAPLVRRSLGRLSRFIAAPRLRSSALLIMAAAGIAMIAVGQYAVSQDRKPFDWPLSSWMVTLFDHEFKKKNVLDFGFPLYIVGGIVFAVFASRAAVPSIEQWTAKIGLSRRRLMVLAAILVVPVAVWAWMNLRLYTKHYDPFYRWLFLFSIVVVVAVLFAVDRMQGRFRRLRLGWSHLVELAVVGGITGTFIGINCRDLNSWRYSTIGDDGEFYVWAHRVLVGTTPPLNWFSQRGPYGEHPILSSAYQALSMRIFGQDLFGWKMASLLAIALTLPFFYWLLRQLLGMRVAVFGTLFLGASHYLFSYAHTGYDNVFPILPTTICLALLVAGIKRNSFVLLFGAGLFAGVGFYTYYSSRAVVGMAVLVLLALGWKRVPIDAFAKVLAGFVMFALPLFAVNKWDVISAVLNRSTTRADYPTYKLLLENIPRTLLGFNFNPSDLHYTAGGLMDEVSVTLAVAGLVLVLARLHHFAYRTLLIWFVVAAVVAGVFSPYSEVSISRMHYALPPMAAFAGIAVDRLLVSLGAILRRPKLEWFAGAATFAALAPLVFVINGRHFFIYSAKHSPTPVDTVIARELSDPKCRDAPLRSVVYHPQPELIVDFNWKFFGMADEKPLQIRFSDMDHVYDAYPATGGVGCVMLTNYRETQTERIAVLMLAGQHGEQDYRVVTDASGADNRRVALTPASRSHRALALSDIQGIWRTNLTMGDGLDRVVKGQEKAFIDTIDDPGFSPVKEAQGLEAGEPVIVVSSGGRAVAYPVRYLIWNGIVNDVLDGQPIAVTFDPIAGSARVYRRTVGGQTLTFGNSGLLRDGNALIYDRQTESWWPQLTGKAIAGDLAGASLEAVPFNVSSWSEFARAYPQGEVLVYKADSGIEYGRNPYLGYDVPNGKPIFTLTPPDPRLAPMRRVAIVEVGDSRFAVPFPDGPAKENSVSKFEIGGQQIVLFYDRMMYSILDTHWLRDSRLVGTFAAYVPSYQGETADFVAAKEGFVDQRTSTPWNVLGHGVGEANKGAQLQPVPVQEGFWFAVAAAYPGIEIRQ
jgi:Protein of unknown function (DUF3179)/Dolichyl-phosphate-mannose-protein mannosyltransferase